MAHERTITVREAGVGNEVQSIHIPGSERASTEEWKEASVPGSPSPTRFSSELPLDLIPVHSIRVGRHHDAACLAEQEQGEQDPDPEEFHHGIQRGTL